MTLSSAAESRLLRVPHEADSADPFVTDTDSAVRRLGRLALRRDMPDASDYFALGDLCARLTWRDGRFHMAYLVKTLEAYRRAGDLSARAGVPADVRVAQGAAGDFARWTLDVARLMPSPQNLAAALWTAAAIPPEAQTATLRSAAATLAARYASGMVAGATESAVGETFAASVGEHAPRPPVTVAETLADEPPPIRSRRDDSGADSSAGPVIAPASAQAEQRLSEAPTLIEASGAPKVVSSGPRIVSYTPVRHTPGEFQIGDRIADRYEVRTIARGGMGVVYLCYDHETDSSTAIKTFQARHLNNERTWDRFRREALIWVELDKHPHVVRAHKVETFGDSAEYARPHILMEFIAPADGLGADLASWIEYRRIDLPLALRVGVQVCAGMQYATARMPGLVHRDLKPANILMRFDGVAKVTDFGLVRTLDSARDTQEMGALIGSSEDTRLTRAGTVVGTLPYLSPEQCQAEMLDPRSDIYAFGAILFEMLSGQQLFEVYTPERWIEAHLRMIPRLPADLAASLPPALIGLLDSCLAKQRSDRPANWDVLRESLSVIYADLTGAPPVLEPDGLQMEVGDLMNKAYSLTEIGYGEAALKAYDQALALDPDNSWILARKGRTLRVLKRYDEALAHLDSALARPSNVASWAWNQKGIVLERMRQWESARDAYQRALGGGRGDAWYAGNLAKMLIKQARPAEALGELERHAPSAHRTADVETVRADALMELNRLDEALTAADLAIQLAPRALEAWITRGMILLRKKHHDQAVAAFAQAARLAPRSIRAWGYLATAYSAAGNHAEALYPAQEAARLKPDDPRAHWRVGLTLLRLDRFSEALEAFDRALALRANWPPALSVKAQALEKLNRLDEAAACYRLIAQEKSGKSPLAFALSRILLRLNRIGEALEAVDNALENDSKNGLLWARRGQILRRARLYDDAAASYERAITLLPNDADAFNGLGMALERRRSFEAAADAYEKAVEAAPHHPVYRLNLCGALLALGRRHDALDVAGEAIDMAPNVPAGWIAKGRALRALNRHDEAVIAYEQALAFAPGDFQAWSGKGAALAALGQRAEALQAFLRASFCDQDNKWVWYRQGELLIEMGRYQEALTALNRALAIDPAFAEAALKRDEARRKLGNLAP